MKNPDRNSFIEAVESFCGIAHFSNPPEDIEIHNIVREAFFCLIANITAVEVSLHKSFPIPREITADDYEKFLRNIKNLQFNDFFVVINPLDVEQEEQVGVTSLLTDFLYIYEDLFGGLMLYESGHIEAASYHWVSRYSSGWGRLVVQSLQAVEEHRIASLNDWEII